MATKKIPPLLMIDEKQRYSLAEGFATLRISPAEGYKQIKAGRIQTVSEGRRKYIPGSELIRRSSSVSP